MAVAANAGSARDAMAGLSAGIDARVGACGESAVRANHRRRLTGSGQAERLDPPAGALSLWAAGDPPVREGNELEVLIDGAQALPRIAAALDGACAAPRSRAGTSRRTSA
jgi:hypothetical protein